MKWDDKEKKGYYNHIPGGNREMKSDYYQQKQQAMKDTYTVMEIGGKIVVVVNAPEKPNENEHWPMLAYIAALSDCTKYPTIEADESYWKERIGQRVEVELRVGLSVTGGLTAIPQQQKQDNEDLWDEVQSRFNAWLFEDGEASLDDIFNDLKSNYSLKRK